MIKICVSTVDAQNLYNEIKQIIESGKHVVVSFEDVELVLPSFLNVAIGQLYGSFSEDTIKAQLKVEKLSACDMEILDLTMNNAKKYHSNKKNYDKAWKVLDCND